MRLMAMTGVAMAALAGAASAESGYFDVSRAQLDLAGGENETTLITGAVSMPLRGHLDFQADVQAADIEGADETAFGGTLHLVGRNPGWMLGAFTGYLNVESQSVYSLGAEGALYFKRWTLAGAAAYADSDDLDQSGVLAQGEARYFVNRNLRIDGLLGFANYETGAGANAEALTFGAGAEFQFHDTPVSMFGQLARREGDQATLDSDIFRIGLRWNFDKDLASRDENGASLVNSSLLVGALTTPILP